LVETNVHAKQQFPVREKTSVEKMYAPIRIARRALTGYNVNDVDVLTDNSILFGLRSTDVISLTGNPCFACTFISTNIVSLTGNLMKPTVSSTNIKSLTGLPRSVIANAVKQSGISCFWIASFLAITLLLSSCRRSYNTQLPAQDIIDVERQQQEALLQINQQLVKEDYETIKAFAANCGWDMQTTETGLWYMIYENGKGEKASAGKIATLEYTVSLLDSTVCYSSATLGPKTFKTGKGGVESGLEEGVLLLRVGDKARMIMPPHLAHGLLGDGDRIPQRAIILYEIELVSLK
jgi:FKBP-type peptidyl-prolyl cis-trans isomerase